MRRFQPSRISLSGAYGAYGVDYDQNYGPQLPADSSTTGTAAPTSLADKLYAKCEALGGAKALGCSAAVGLAATFGEAALKKVMCDWFKQCEGLTTTTTTTTTPTTLAPTTTTTQPPKSTIYDRYKGLMTTEEYNLWKSNIRKYGAMPTPLKKGWSAQKLVEWMTNLDKEGQLILDQRNRQQVNLPTTNKTGGEGNTLLYVGGGVALLALAAGGYYFYTQSKKKK